MILHECLFFKASIIFPIHLSAIIKKNYKKAKNGQLKNKLAIKH